MNGFRDLVGKVTQLPQLVGEPYASDPEILRAQAWASGSHRLPTRPGKGQAHAAQKWGWSCHGECVTPHLAHVFCLPVSTVGAGWGVGVGD